MDEAQIITEVLSSGGSLGLVLLVGWRWLNTKFKEIEDRAEKHQEKVTAIGSELGNVEDRLDTMSSQLEQCKQGLNEVRHGQHRLELRQTALEARFGIVIEVQDDAPTGPVN